MLDILATNLSDCKRDDATDLFCGFWRHPLMVERVVANAILAQNLRRIIEKSGMSPRGWARNHGIVERNIQRILKQEQSPSLELLQQIADGAGLFAWQLLTPNLDPANPPVVTMTEAERIFYQRVRKDIANLPPV